jgi:hypothetical protein
VSGALRVGWYRFRATFRQRFGGLASLVVLIALVGGVAMASLAGARRTQSSFSAFWASTNPSDLLGATSVLNPTTGQQPYVPQRLAAIAHLPHVRHVESSAGLNVVFLSPTGAPLQVPFPPSAGNGSASVDGAGFDQDRLVVTSGRLADPRRADEFDVSALVAQQLGLRVGGSVPIGIYTNAQVALRGFGTTAVPPHVRTSVKLVGIVALNQAVVADQADAASNALLAWFTPALTRPLLGCCVNYTGSDVQVDRPANVAAVQAEISALLPAGFPPLQPTSVVRAKAERAIKPQAIALAVFGGLAALAALLIAGQVIGRQVRAGDLDRAVMQAVGAGPATVAADGLLGIGCAVVAGSLLAVAVAVALSPLSPIGPVRRFEPGSPVAFDWTVLAAGAGVLVVALTGVALAMAYRAAPQRATARRSDERGSALARSAARAGLPVPVVAGVRFALEPGAPRARAPVRSAIVGAALAVVVVVATLTFGLSLHTLVSRPPLYGWNWDYALVAGGASGDIPQQQVTQLLDHDGDVAAWSAAYLATITIDGEPVPVLGEEPGAAVGPAVLSGHGVAAADQVVLGPLTLSSLHKRVGDTVTVDAGRGASRLQVVGTAAFPAVGTSGLHMEMASGGAVPTDVLTVADRNPFNDPVPGPNLALVRLRSGVNQGAALARLNAIGTATSNTANFGVAVTPVQRPAEIVNYRSMGSTPAVLDAGLAAGAAVALGLTLLASVRRRRHDLALLKALGFTRRQLAAAVAWQSTIAVAIGVVVGVPLGIAAGRWLWDAFARDIHVVPSPSVPAVTVTLAAVAALLLANVVAALPGRRAARTPVALVLRSE